MTRILLPLLLMTALLGAAPSGLAADEDFDARLREAIDNLDTADGARFDRELGMSLQSRPEMFDAVSACLRAHPGAHRLQGYFHFRTGRDYELVLRPDTRFARCLSAAMQGHAVPAPPRVPYVNHFTFSFDDSAVSG